MSNSINAAAASVDDLGAPDSWEAADVEESMKRLLLSTSPSFPSATDFDFDAPLSQTSNFAASSSTRLSAKTPSFSEEAINQVDQFLRDALHNPRERLSILRMEQDVENFIRDPTAQQMEFQQLPTSYQRLAAHRVAQHYFLQSMVLLDNNLPEGASRIIVRKTSDECQYPRIRLADIPVNLPKEDSAVVKLAIKQRPQKHSNSSGLGSGSGRANQAKSVEERKEEYDRARARIFNSSAHITSSAKPKNEPRRSDTYSHASVGVPKFEKHSVSGSSDLSTGRSLTDSSSGSSRSARSRIEKEPVGRQKTINKVAIIRDREVDSKDPDYNRSYDRYMQRFDPGFGFNTGPYPIQPMYAPAVNYNTEFPQLTPAHQQAENHQSHPSAQHLPAQWASPSNHPTMGYAHPEAIMAAYNPNHISARPNTAIYMQSSQFPGHPGMPFIHSHEHMHQPFSQSLHQQHDASLGLARPR